jgi:hypothetical protein
MRGYWPNAGGARSSAAPWAEKEGAEDDVQIAFYGSSLLSTYWNGAATYYRGLLRALAERGHRITFFEPDAFGRQQHKDIDPPGWAEVVVYPQDEAAAIAALEQGRGADVLVKASGVGVFDDLLQQGVLAMRAPPLRSIGMSMRRPRSIASRPMAGTRCTSSCRASTWC